MKLEGKYIKLKVIKENEDGRGDLEGILESEFAVGGVSFLRNKKRLINTGLIKEVDYNNNILQTATSTYELEII